MQQGGPQQTDQTASFFWIICIVFGAAIIFWWVNEKYVVIPAFWLRSHEIDLLRLFAKAWMPAAKFLHLPLPDMTQLDALQHYMQQAKPDNVSWHSFTVVNVALGRWTRYPIMLIFLTLAAFVFLRGAGQFHHSYNMKSLRAIGQEVWPQITPIISLDLVKEDIDQGPWAMAKPPLNFCREHDLLSVKSVGGKKVFVIKQKPSYRLFALQLGPLWKGMDALPIHAKALALIFMARATGQRPLSNKILSQIAASSASGKLDFTDVSEQLIAFKNHKIIQWLEKHHAYMTTLMASLLEIGRSDGVLATAEFLWLKPVDRRLWFVLNSVGRRTAFVEVAGVFSQWKAEQKLGRALRTPMIKGAVDALEETLQNILFVEKGDKWHTSNAD